MRQLSAWSLHRSITLHLILSCLPTSFASVTDRPCVSARWRSFLAHPCRSAVARRKVSHSSDLAPGPCQPHGEYATGWNPQPALAHCRPCFALLAASVSFRWRRPFSGANGYVVLLEGSTPLRRGPNLVLCPTQGGECLLAAPAHLCALYRILVVPPLPSSGRCPLLSEVRTTGHEPHCAGV